MNRQLRWNCRAAGLIPPECPMLHCANVCGQVLQIVCIFTSNIPNINEEIFHVNVQ